MKSKRRLPQNHELSYTEKQILEILEKQYNIKSDSLANYAFEIRGNRIFIMTKQVKQFDKIKPVRKGHLFATVIGNKIIVSENITEVLGIQSKNSLS